MSRLNTAENPVLIAGVVSDTHIPDRAFELHPDLIPGLINAKVNIILHAGDISSPQTLDTLSNIVPVEAVRGNRDLFTIHNLPAMKEMTLAGVNVLLTHGHGNLLHYIWDKWIYILKNYQFERYQQFLSKLAPQAKVIIFGHTHKPENRIIGDTLFFNPGSAGPNYDHSQPSFGILRFYPDGKIRGEICFLKNLPIVNHMWVRE